MSLSLTHFENKLFTAIKQFIGTYLPSTTARVAGGWVRDKLLCIPSNDIDIVLDTHSGISFVTLFKEKVTTLELSNIGLIKVNPEKSKHLETAAIIIEGIHVDFMQFRTETYNTTRIPLVKEGTIENDVLRRDLTINAMYYNIINEKIEDITTHGLVDLKNKILRTPLEPRVTFLDDPLRILRVIRFMVYLKFEICDDILEAVKCKDVKNALKTKISNERVGIEIMKIIKAENGYTGMLLIARYNLIVEIFKPISITAVNIINVEDGFETKENNTSDGLNISTEVDFIMSNIQNIETQKNIIIEFNTVKKFVTDFLSCKYPLDRTIFNLYTILHMFINTFDNYVSLNIDILKEKLKWPKQYAKRIGKIEENILILKKSKLKFNDIDLIINIRMMGVDWLNSFYLYHFIYNSDNIPEICEYIYRKGYEKANLVIPLLRGNIIKQKLGCKGSEISKWKEISVALQISKNIKDYKYLITMLCEYKKNEMSE